MLKTCQNPFCKLPVTGKGNRERRFCDRGCRLTGWILKRAAKLLVPLGQAKSWELLSQLSGEEKGQ